jgi:hypothetical protein
VIPLNDDDTFDKWLRQATKEFIESTAVPLDVDDALATVDDDDAFDKWLLRANKEFIESTAASLDVDDALATVKRCAREVQKTASDGQILAARNHIRDATFSLSVGPVNRARKTRFKFRSVGSKFLTTKSLAAVSAATAAGIVFLSATLFSESHSPFSEISALGASTTAQTSSTLEPVSGGQPASATQPAPALPPILSDRQSEPPLPRNQPLQPSTTGVQSAPPVPGEQLLQPSAPVPQPALGAASGAQSAPYPPASGHPTQPEKPTTDSPEIQKEQRVELSAQSGQDSADIDSWRQVSDKSGDLQMDQHGIYTVRGAKLSIINDSAAPTYGRCAQIQNWTTRVDFSALQEGSHLCAQSSKGRYAMLRIAALPSSQEIHGRFIFYGTTWQCAKAAGVRSAPTTTTPGSARPSTTTRPPNQSCGN